MDDQLSFRDRNGRKHHNGDKEKVYRNSMGWTIQQIRFQTYAKAQYKRCRRWEVLTPSGKFVALEPTFLDAMREAVNGIMKGLQ